MARRRVFAEPKKEYYHIPLKPKRLFRKFRAHDVGKPRGLIRVAGVRKDTGGWIPRNICWKNRLRTRPGARRRKNR